MILRSAPQHKIKLLPKDSDERKKWPAVARQSYMGNEKHCDAEEAMHWEFDKSNDHHDCLMRHLLEEDYAAVVWRALAILETQIQNQNNER